MKTFKLVPLAMLVVAAACGGSNGAPTTADFQANAMTFDKVSISQNDGDDNEPASALAPSAALTMAPAASSDAVTRGGSECHPHLFANTDEVIGRVNFHFFKLVRHVEEVIKTDPASSTGNTRIFENVRAGIDRRLTITGTTNADGSVTYDFKLELAAVATTETFVQVMSGTLTHSGPPAGEVADAGAAVAVENKGNVSFDFDALHSVVASEPARGQLSDTFDNLHDPVKGVKRTATITLSNFIPDDAQAVMHGPRNGSYTWEREPGVGGFFQYQDSLILNCPSNPARAVADIAAVARWYKAADGSVHGRGDAQATGGQIPLGDKWEGVTCAQGSTSTAPAEGEWLMKEEDSTGASIFVGHVQIGVTPCDAIFGAVPDETDSINDYNFSSAVTFPGEL
jgi:hypothetical protein